MAHDKGLRYLGYGEFKRLPLGIFRVGLRPNLKMAGNDSCVVNPATWNCNGYAALGNASDDSGGGVDFLWEIREIRVELYPPHSSPFFISSVDGHAGFPAQPSFANISLRYMPRHGLSYSFHIEEDKTTYALGVGNMTGGETSMAQTGPVPVNATSREDFLDVFPGEESILRCLWKGVGLFGWIYGVQGGESKEKNSNATRETPIEDIPRWPGGIYVNEFVQNGTEAGCAEMELGNGLEEAPGAETVMELRNTHCECRWGEWVALGG